MGDNDDPNMKNQLRRLIHRLIPLSTRRRLGALSSWPPAGSVDFGSFRRLKPISASWGMERGKPVDRYYIEKFLARHSQDIHGVVLEIGDNTYTKLFGGEKVSQSEVLHVADEKPQVTLVANLENGEGLPADHFDCVLLTQTLQFILDAPAVLQTIQRILKPDGVVLITVPGISQISRYDMDRWGDYWRFTTKSMQRLLEAVFPDADIRVNAYGNVLAAMAFLYGLAAEELRVNELEHFDPDYELLITARASKVEGPG